MARKNVFDIAPSGETPSPAETSRPASGLARPLMGMERSTKPAGPVGAISQSLGGINDKVQRANEIETQLARGQAVVELDPELIDGSFVVDRLGVSAEDQEMLVSQIREHGQQVPILVRPHPTTAGRYQVAYGHRRLAAIRVVGGSVRAVVRALTDEQLVVSQGQENNARTDLSFIERSFFAAKLESRNFTRDIIMSALGVDKAALSRMIALIARLPSELIEAIGPAPGFGRTRWAELADLMEDKARHAKVMALIGTDGFVRQSSDARFQAVYDLLKTARPAGRNDVWKTDSGLRPVRISESDERLSLSFDKRVDADFGAFVEKKLSALYEEFLRAKKSSS